MGRSAPDGWVSFTAEAGASRPGLPQRGVARNGLAMIGGALATVAAVTIAAVLTLIFAATLVVAVALSAALIALYAATHRRRPEGVLIEARKVGHSWVAYGWDERRR